MDLGAEYNTASLDRNPQSRGVVTGETLRSLPAAEQLLVWYWSII